ncbi:MAG: hypothetical protein SGPRY_014888, partial [Prymnesium sp.]
LTGGAAPNLKSSQNGHPHLRGKVGVVMKDSIYKETMETKLRAWMAGGMPGL